MVFSRRSAFFRRVTRYYFDWRLTRKLLHLAVHLHAAKPEGGAIVSTLRLESDMRSRTTRLKSAIKRLSGSASSLASSSAPDA